MSTLHRKPRGASALGGHELASHYTTIDILPSTVPSPSKQHVGTPASAKPRRHKDSNSSGHGHGKYARRPSLFSGYSNKTNSISASGTIAPAQSSKKMSTTQLRIFFAACVLVYLSALVFADDIVRLGKAMKSDATRDRLFASWKPMQSAASQYLRAIVTDSPTPTAAAAVTTSEPNKHDSPVIISGDSDAAEDDAAEDDAVVTNAPPAFSPPPSDVSQTRMTNTASTTVDPTTRPVFTEAITAASKTVDPSKTIAPSKEEADAVAVAVQATLAPVDAQASIAPGGIASNDVSDDDTLADNTIAGAITATRTTPTNDALTPPTVVEATTTTTATTTPLQEPVRMDVTHPALIESTDATQDDAIRAAAAAAADAPTEAVATVAMNNIVVQTPTTSP